MSNFISVFFTRYQFNPCIMEIHNLVYNYINVSIIKFTIKFSPFQLTFMMTWHKQIHAVKVEALNY